MRSVATCLKRAVIFVAVFMAVIFTMCLSGDARAECAFYGRIKAIDIHGGIRFTFTPNVQNVTCPCF